MLHCPFMVVEGESESGVRGLAKVPSVLRTKKTPMGTGARELVSDLGK
jgi:hypothetical protein